MNDEDVERMVQALEMMANAMNAMARTYELLYYKMYPPRSSPRDIRTSKPESEEERLRRDQGATGEETTEDWMNLDEEESMGPRERAFLDQERKKQADAKQKAQIRPDPPER